VTTTDMNSQGLGMRKGASSNMCIGLGMGDTSGNGHGIGMSTSDGSSTSLDGSVYSSPNTSCTSPYPVSGVMVPYNK
jgi:hypothetical protein